MRSTYQMTTSSAKKYCNCNGNFNIPYSGHPNNPACLQSIPSYGRCNTNAQCYQVDESYACVNHVCQCVGQWTLIKGHRPQVKCLAPAKPNQRCLYDEACTYGDPNSYCIETCQCKDGYKVDVTGDYCADYSTDPSVNVTIFEAMYFNDTENHNYQAVLRLSNYSSGNYQCDFTFNDTGDGTINNQMAVFQISTKTGAPLNSPCGSSSECATLNAQCDTGETGGSAATCKCSGFFDINYSNDRNTPACLPPVSETGKCNTAAQCFQQDQDYNCTSDSKCECLGQKIAVAEKHDEIMCLGGVAMYDPCIYSEQCYLSTNNSHCSNAQCNCVQGYEFNETVSICYEIHIDYEPRLSNSAIFGIVFGCALGIALIVAVVLKRKVTVTFSLRDGFGIKINHKDDGGIEYCFNWCIFGHKGCSSDDEESDDDRRYSVYASTPSTSNSETLPSSDYREHGEPARLNVYLSREAVYLDQHEYHCVCQNLAYLRSTNPDFDWNGALNAQRERAAQEERARAAQEDRERAAQEDRDRAAQEDRARNASANTQSRNRSRFDTFRRARDVIRSGGQTVYDYIIIRLREDGHPREGTELDEDGHPRNLMELDEDGRPRDLMELLEDRHPRDLMELHEDGHPGDLIELGDTEA